MFPYTSKARKIQTVAGVATVADMMYLGVVLVRIVSMLVPWTIAELNPADDDSSGDDCSRTFLDDGAEFPAFLPFAPPLGHTTSPDAPPSVP
ncbi:hypothetical protein WUBG_11311 [Wuchereria bancrofti]|uniref:Uncharacterized protein n=1 Tax=Wuchereria bancrofti TaxID=6293 RepID=J9E6K0_WUCBA|nr:hypothetical protein WUBG_11311 [Wuchereria bancrofti]VDM09112.1 unnamed protein product [Wuchereria bancrofti]